MALLNVITNVCYAIGKTPPTAVVTSSDSVILELLVLASKSGQELARGYDWPELMVDNTFSAISSVNQGAIIGLSASATVQGSDYERMVPNTFWNRTTDTPIVAAIAAEWAQGVAVGTGLLPMKFIIIQGNLQIGPTTAPTTGNVMAFMYFSNKWCKSSAGAGKRSWSADTDLGIIPEQILELDLIWRWKQAKGRAYAEDLETAERAINRYTGAAPGRRLLMLGGGSSYGYVTNIPEGNWNP